MRILIAEDDPVSRRLLEVTLTKWGYEVQIACDGAQAWDALQADDSPRFAILDWMMPGMHGVQVCREIRKQAEEPYTYIILLTAKSMKSDIVEGMDAGADDYLTKPFDSNELKVRIRAGQRILDLQSELIAAREAIRAQATHDPLTGLLNRGAILDALHREMARSTRDKAPICTVMVDLDNFKRINDAYGHLAGDLVLAEISGRIAESCRPYDLAGRYGGDEFLLVVPGTSAADAAHLGDRVRANISGRPVPIGDNTLSISASLGVAEMVSAHETLESLVCRADIAAYKAKAEGRNRTCTAEAGTCDDTNRLPHSAVA